MGWVSSKWRITAACFAAAILGCGLLPAGVLAQETAPGLAGGSSKDLEGRLEAALAAAEAALASEEARLDDLAARHSRRTLADGRPSSAQAAANVRLWERRIRELEASEQELRETLNGVLASLGSDLAALTGRLSARLEQAEQEKKAREQAERERVARRQREEAQKEWEKLGLVMVRVDGGSFTMGCQDGRDGDCYGRGGKPAHRVRVRSFEIGKYEVTQALWEAVMGENPSSFKGCAKCPVEQVSWDDVQMFLRELNARTGLAYRLPTEAEWEYAARGGQQSRGYTYAGSNDPRSVAWYLDNSTHPVGRKQANELGLYDMSGNVWEWVQDCWNDSYQGAPSDSRPWERGDCGRRVARGGSWGNVPGDLRSANRSWSDTGLRGGILGFRLTRTLTP